MIDEVNLHIEPVPIIPKNVSEVFINSLPINH